METTTKFNGDPYSTLNKLCYIGYGFNREYSILTDSFDSLDASNSLIIGANLKFDLAWCRRGGVKLNNIEVWDVQLAHFMLVNQSVRFPSLNEICEYYGLPKKLDYIAENYWDKGIDTPDIPVEEITEYLKQDCLVTELVYQKQKESFQSRPNLYRLFQLDCMDLLVLQEMEWNGIPWDSEESLKEAEKVREEASDIERELCSYYPDVPINFNSVDHLSAFLYGGTITIEERVPNGLFKTGSKAGQPKFRKEEKSYFLKGLVRPKKEWALKKEGLYATNEKVLRQINHKAVKSLVRLGELSKLLDYLEGYPELIKEKQLRDNRLHGKFNQCIVPTGRLSSSDPNLQNIDKRALKFAVSRYD